MLLLQERADAPSSFRVGLLADRLRDHSSQSRGTMLTKNRIGLLITLSALAAFVAVGSSSLGEISCKNKGTDQFIRSRSC